MPTGLECRGEGSAGQDYIRAGCRCYGGRRLRISRKGVRHAKVYLGTHGMSRGDDYRQGRRRVPPLAVCKKGEYKVTIRVSNVVNGQKYSDTQHYTLRCVEREEKEEEQPQEEKKRREKRRKRNRNMQRHKLCLTSTSS